MCFYKPWIFIGRTAAEIEVPKLWSPGAKSQLIGKDPDARKDWRQKEKVVAEGETDMNLSKLQGTVGDRGVWRATVHGVAKNQTRLSEWTTIWMTLNICRHVNPKITSHIDAQCCLRMIWNHVFWKAFKPTWCFSSHITNFGYCLVILQGNNFCNEFFSLTKSNQRDRHRHLMMLT